MTSISAKCVGGPFSGVVLRVNWGAQGPPRRVTWAPLNETWGVLPIEYEWHQPRDEDDEPVGDALWRYVPSE